MHNMHRRYFHVILKRIFCKNPATAQIPRKIRGLLALLWRPLLFRVPFIAVTGSCGKTTTVELIDRMLNGGNATRRHIREYNGLGATYKNLLRTWPWQKFVVLEVSGGAPGKIRQQMALIRPKTGIVTIIGSDHYRAFGSAEAIAEEKTDAVRPLPENGTAILNVDDPMVRAMASQTNAKIVKVGRAEDANLQLCDVQSAWPGRLSFTVTWEDQRIPVRTQLVGEFWTTSILCALACALDRGISISAAVKVIESFEPIYSRCSPHFIDGGPTFILDTAKAPSKTIHTAVEILVNAQAPRKTLVMGNISDYSGSGSPKYRNLARLALSNGIRVIGVGKNSGTILKLRPEFPDGIIHHFSSSMEAHDFLTTDVIPNELILLKSAASGRIERIVLNWKVKEKRCWAEDCGLTYCHSCEFKYSGPPS